MKIFNFFKDKSNAKLSYICKFDNLDVAKLNLEEKSSIFQINLTNKPQTNGQIITKIDTEEIILTSENNKIIYKQLESKILEEYNVKGEIKVELNNKTFYWIPPSFETGESKIIDINRNTIINFLPSNDKEMSIKCESVIENENNLSLELMFMGLFLMKNYLLQEEKIVKLILATIGGEVFKFLLAFLG